MSHIKKNIFIFGTVPYFDVGGGQRSAQLAKVFNKMGYSIYYIYAYECTENNIPMISIPTVYHKYIENAKCEEISDYAKEGDIFIFEAPIKSFEKYLGLLKAGGSKYPVDEAKDAGVDFTQEETFKAVTRRMEVLVNELEELLK